MGNLLAKLTGNEFEKTKWLLGEAAMASVTRSAVTDTIRENAKFHKEAGIHPYLRRYSRGKCCDWCDSMQGAWEYGEQPDDFWRIHKHCTCVIEYKPSKYKRADIIRYVTGEDGKMSKATDSSANRDGLGAKDDGKTPRQRPKKHGYEDITGHWYPNATPGSHIVEDADEVTVNGITYKVDGRNVQLSYSPHEKDVAELLEKEVGGELKMLPRVNNPQGIKTADYLFHGKEYDLKTLGKKQDIGKNRIFNRVKKSKGQANNLIIDITDSVFGTDFIESQIAKIYDSYETKFVDEIVIVRDNKIIKVVKRKI